MQFFGGSEISPSPPVPTASGNNAHMMYVFNRNGVCLLYREWNRPLHTLNAQQDHKLMFGLLFSLKSLTAKMDPTKYMLHFHFHIYQFQYEFSRAKVYWFIAGLVLKFDLEFELDGFGGLCFEKLEIEYLVLLNFYFWNMKKYFVRIVELWLLKVGFIVLKGLGSDETNNIVNLLSIPHDAQTNAIFMIVYVVWIFFCSSIHDILLLKV